MVKMKGKFRLNQLLNKIIPNLIFIFTFFGVKLILNELIPYLLETTSVKFYHLITIYKFIFISQVSLVIALYLSIYLNFFSSNHQDSAQESFKKIAKQKIVYQCVDQYGSPLRCKICDDAIIPLRGRHCLDCEKCIVGFDHHCVWFAQCIQIGTLKPFIQVLLLAASTILTGLIPIYPIVVKNVLKVVRLTWNDEASGETLRRVWWNRWWSWAGGPIYRYLGGLYLGYYHYPQVLLEFPSVSSNNKLPSTHQSLDEPRLSALLTTAAATMVLLVIIAMLVIVVKNNILNGLSTVEIERARRWKQSPTWDPRIKLWVPSNQQDNNGTGTVVLLPPGIPIFDLGPKKNFQQIMGNQVWNWFVPWNTNRGLNGIEWPISVHWMNYLRQLDPYCKDT